MDAKQLRTITHECHCFFFVLFLFTCDRFLHYGTPLLAPGISKSSPSGLCCNFISFLPAVHLLSAFSSLCGSGIFGFALSRLAYFSAFLQYILFRSLLCVLKFKIVPGVMVLKASTD